MGFADYSFSAEMRDTLERMTRNIVDKIRPAYRYGTVQSIDRINSKCTVLLNGDSNPVIVSLTGIYPAVGQSVRVGGNGTDKFVEGLVGSQSDGRGFYVDISSGESLDDYIQPGVYTIADNTIAAGVLMAPTNYRGTLEVTRGRGPVMQTFTVSNGIKFRRTRNTAGAWTKWWGDAATQVLTSLELDSWIRQDIRWPVVEFFQYRHWTSGEIRTATGPDVDAGRSPRWQTPTLGSGATRYGDVYATPSYAKTGEGIVVLAGLVGNASTGVNVFTLPAGYRPAAKMMFTVETANSTTGRVDITPDGVVRIVAGSGWTSLDGIMFPSADVAPDSAWTAVNNFNTGWSSYHTMDSTWPVLGYWKDPLGRVWFRGLLRQNATQNLGVDTTGFWIPFRSLWTSHIPTYSTGGFLGVDVRYGDANNTAFVVKGRNTHAISWVCLSSMVFVDPNVRFDWKSIDFGKQGTWVRMSADFPEMVYMNFRDGITLWDGMIKNGSIASTIAFIPAEANPDVRYDVYESGGGRRIFPGLSTDVNARTDLYQGWNDARSSVNANNGANSWYSLRGVMYLRGEV